MRGVFRGEAERRRLTSSASFHRRPPDEGGNNSYQPPFYNGRGTPRGGARGFHGSFQNRGNRGGFASAYRRPAERSRSSFSAWGDVSPFHGYNNSAPPSPPGPSDQEKLNTYEFTRHLEQMQKEDGGCYTDDGDDDDIMMSPMMKKTGFGQEKGDFRGHGASEVEEKKEQTNDTKFKRGGFEYLHSPGFGSSQVTPRSTPSTSPTNKFKSGGFSGSSIGFRSSPEPVWTRSLLPPVTFPSYSSVKPPLTSTGPTSPTKFKTGGFSDSSDVGFPPPVDLHPFSPRPTLLRTKLYPPGARAVPNSHPCVTRSNLVPTVPVAESEPVVAASPISNRSRRPDPLKWSPLEREELAHKILGRHANSIHISRLRDRIQIHLKAFFWTNGRDAPVDWVDIARKSLASHGAKENQIQRAAGILKAFSEEVVVSESSPDAPVPESSENFPKFKRGGFDESAPVGFGIPKVVPLSMPVPDADGPAKPLFTPTAAADPSEKNNVAEHFEKQQSVPVVPTENQNLPNIANVLPDQTEIVVQVGRQYSDDGWDSPPSIPQKDYSGNGRGLASSDNGSNFTPGAFSHSVVPPPPPPPIVVATSPREVMSVVTAAGRSVFPIGTDPSNWTSRETEAIGRRILGRFAKTQDVFSVSLKLRVQLKRFFKENGENAALDWIHICRKSMGPGSLLSHKACLHSTEEFFNAAAILKSACSGELDVSDFFQENTPVRVISMSDYISYKPSKQERQMHNAAKKWKGADGVEFTIDANLYPLNPLPYHDDLIRTFKIRNHTKATHLERNKVYLVLLSYLGEPIKVTVTGASDRFLLLRDKERKTYKINYLSLRLYEKNKKVEQPEDNEGSADSTEMQQSFNSETLPKTCIVEDTAKLFREYSDDGWDSPPSIPQKDDSGNGRGLASSEPKKFPSCGFPGFSNNSCVNDSGTSDGFASSEPKKWSGCGVSNKVLPFSFAHAAKPVSCVLRTFYGSFGRPSGFGGCSVGFGALSNVQPVPPISGAPAVAKPAPVTPLTIGTSFGRSGFGGCSIGFGTSSNVQSVPPIFGASAIAKPKNVTPLTFEKSVAQHIENPQASSSVPSVPAKNDIKKEDADGFEFSIDDNLLPLDAILLPTPVILALSFPIENRSKAAHLQLNKVYVVRLFSKTNIPKYVKISGASNRFVRLFDEEGKTYRVNYPSLRLYEDNMPSQKIHAQKIPQSGQRRHVRNNYLPGFFGTSYSSANASSAAALAKKAVASTKVVSSVASTVAEAASTKPTVPKSASGIPIEEEKKGDYLENLIQEVYGAEENPTKIDSGNPKVVQDSAPCDCQRWPSAARAILGPDAKYDDVIELAAKIKEMITDSLNSGYPDWIDISRTVLGPGAKNDDVKRVADILKAGFSGEEAEASLKEERPDSPLKMNERSDTYSDDGWGNEPLPAFHKASEGRGFYDDGWRTPHKTNEGSAQRVEKQHLPISLEEKSTKVSREYSDDGWGSSPPPNPNKDVNLKSGSIPNPPVVLPPWKPAPTLPEKPVKSLKSVDPSTGSSKLRGFGYSPPVLQKPAPKPAPASVSATPVVNSQAVAGPSANVRAPPPPRQVAEIFPDYGNAPDYTNTIINIMNNEELRNLVKAQDMDLFNLMVQYIVDTTILTLNI